MHRIVRILLCFAAASAALSSAEKKPLTNADVVKMKKADLPDSTIVAAIQNSPPAFDTSPETIIDLKSAGISPAIIEAMLNARSQPKDDSVDPPKEAEIDAMLTGIARQQSEGVVALESFRKIDGQPSRSSGVHYYKMDFELLVRFSQDCIWRNVHLDKQLRFQVARRQRSNSGGWDEFLHVTQNPGVQVKAGSVFRITGYAQLEKSESGWKAAELIHTGITQASADAITQVQSAKNAEIVKAAGAISGEELGKLVAAASPEAGQDEQNFTSSDGKVSAKVPAGFALEKHRKPVVGRFVSPGGNGYNITVICDTPGLLSRNPTLESVARDTRRGAENDQPGAVFTEMLPTRLAGGEAWVFGMSVVEKGKVEHKAVTVAVVRNHVLGVVLHSPPEQFSEAFKAYRRVCDTYALAAK